jgi:hypothetical protein
MLEWPSSRTQTANVGQDVGKKEPSHLIPCWWESKSVQPLWKTVWRFLKRQKLPYYLALPLLGIYPKECKSGYNKDTCTDMFIAEFFTMANLWK